jgi:hypothetical protein
LFHECLVLHELNIHIRLCAAQAYQRIFTRLSEHQDGGQLVTMVVSWSLWWSAGQPKRPNLQCQREAFWNDMLLTIYGIYKKASFNQTK